MRIANKSKQLVILLVWFVFLLATATLATNGNPARFMSYYVAESWAYLANKQVQVTPAILLKEYTSAYETPPPIGLVLDSVFEEKSWLSMDYYAKAKMLALTTNDQREVIKNIYFTLFDRINNHLEYIVQNYDPNKTDSNNRISATITLGYPFSERTVHKTVLLPVEVTDWVLKIPEMRKHALEQEQFLNSLLLVTVLGALGSLIYAVKDITDSTKDTSVVTFALRPFFGIFLSIVLFVLFMVAHTLVSASGISNIRYSTIYVLALAAGLLSDQTYSVLVFKLNKALTEFKSKTE